MQRVRRHRVRDVLDATAAASDVLTNFDYDRGPRPGFADCVQPFSLAAVAKAAVVAGNDHRDKPVTDRDLAQVCRMFVGVEDPILNTEPGALRREGSDGAARFAVLAKEFGGE